MKCSEIEKHLSEYIDGELALSVSRQIKEHLADCSQCREKLESLKSVVNSLAKMPKAEAPPDFLNRFHDRLEEQGAVQKIFNTLFVPFRIKFPLEIVTVAALGILIFFIVQPIHQQQMQKLQPQKKEAVAKKREVPQPKSQPAEPAPRMLAKAPVAKSEAKTPEVNESPAPVAVSEKQGGAEQNKDKFEESNEPLPAQSPAMESKSKVTEEKKAIPPIIISMLVPAEKEIPAEGQRASTEQAFKMRESTRDMEKRKSYTLSGAAKPMSDAIKHESAPSNEPSQPVSADTLEQKITGLVQQVQGKIIAIEKDDAGQPTSMNIAIPSSAYNHFTQQISALGKFESSPPELSAKGNQLIPVTIHFICR